jgi:Arc/MetJ-type ribon-helix-helix transcriptional regulator
MLELLQYEVCNVTRNQLNIRISDELAEYIDAKRIELSKTMKVIPSRSDVVRFALEGYLSVSLADTDRDLRTANQMRKGLPRPKRTDENLD